jgi:PAS domain S-box-containing protein
MPKEIRDSAILNPAADTATGITEIRRQESLLKTRALQNAILSSANFSVIATDTKGVIQIFNVGAERMLGYAAADVMNKISPADISDPQEVIARAKALSAELGTPITPGFEALVFKASRGIEDTYELTCVREDGSRFPAIVSVTALRDDQGVIIGYLLIGTDISERKQAEEALASSLSLLKATVESTADGILVVDLAGRITLWNHKFAEMWKIPEELLSKHLDELALNYVFQQMVQPEAFLAKVRELYGQPEASSNDQLDLADGRIFGRYSQPQRIGDEVVGRVWSFSDITERKQAEEALLRNEALLTEVQEVSHVGGWEYDIQTRHLTWTEEVYRIHELPPDYDPNDIANDIQFYSRDDRKEIEEAFNRAVTTGERYALELRFETAKGNHRWVRTIGQPELKDGHPVRVVGNIADITERKQAEEALRESEALYQSLVKVSPLSICRKDLAGRFTFANQRFLEALNPSLTDLIGLTDFDLHPPELAEKYRRDDRAVMDSGQAREFVEERAVLGGESTIIQSYKTPIYDGAGKINGVQISFWDITERTKLEQEVAHLASFPALSPYGIIEIGCDGSVRFANAAAIATLARLGLDPNARQFLPGTPEELILLRSQCERNPQTQELHLGEASFLRVVAAPPSGDSLRVYVTDITDRKKMEEEIRALNADLDLRVRQRTAELTAANKELETFSYSVSHDLRSPLRSIDGFSQAFLEDYGALVPPEGREDLERVRRATQHMGQLIDDMLVLSRVTRSQMHVQETDMSALAASVAEELARDNPQRNVQVSIEPGMTAAGDPQLLRIVLVNLLGNAWKFTSKQEHAHVMFGSTRDAEHGLVFFVRDDGAGFDPKYKDKLFVAFQRLHSLKEFPGTGIGLATVERAVRRHGGGVWAEGEVDRGATFYFSIPDLYTSIPTKGEQP